MGRHHQGAGVRRDGPHITEEIQTRAVREADVEDEEIHLELAGEELGLLNRAGGEKTMGRAIPRWSRLTSIPASGSLSSRN